MPARLAWSCHPTMHFVTACQPRRMCFRHCWMSPSAVSNELSSTYRTSCEKNTYCNIDTSLYTSKGLDGLDSNHFVYEISLPLRLKDCDDESLGDIAGRCTSEARCIYI